MNNTKKLIIIGLGMLFSVGVFSVSCKKGLESADEMKMAARMEQTEKEILYYTCGMHPSVRVIPEDYEKGNDSCPICNMDLVPVYKDQAGMEMGAADHEEHEDGKDHLQNSRGCTQQIRNDEHQTAFDVRRLMMRIINNNPARGSTLQRGTRRQERGWSRCLPSPLEPHVPSLIPSYVRARPSAAPPRRPRRTPRRQSHDVAAR